MGALENVSVKYREKGKWDLVRSEKTEGGILEAGLRGMSWGEERRKRAGVRD